LHHIQKLRHHADQQRRLGVGFGAVLFPVFKCAGVGAAGGGVGLPSRWDFSASKPSVNSAKILRFFFIANRPFSSSSRFLEQVQVNLH
jgi:hypothetical protein